MHKAELFLNDLWLKYRHEGMSSTNEMTPRQRQNLQIPYTAKIRQRIVLVSLQSCSVASVNGFAFVTMKDGFDFQEDHGAYARVWRFPNMEIAYL